jgi:hypothetical protein
MQFRQEVKGCRFLIVVKRIRPFLAGRGIAARRPNVSLNKQSDGLSSFLITDLEDRPRRSLTDRGRGLCFLRSFLGETVERGPTVSAEGADRPSRHAGRCAA